MFGKNFCWSRDIRPERCFERLLLAFVEFTWLIRPQLVQQVAGSLLSKPRNPTAHRIAMDAKDLNKLLDLKSLFAKMQTRTSLRQSADDYLVFSGPPGSLGLQTP